MLRSSFAHALRCAFAGTFFGFVLISSAAAQTTYWELEPVQNPKVEGAFTTIGGRTAPAGVHFKLKNNKLTAPVVLTLIAQDVAKPVKISAFKESGPLFDLTTNAQGKASRSFRSGEEILFKLTGESGVGYQLSVWRGPEIILPKPSPFKPMSEVVGTAAAAATAAAGAPAAVVTGETKAASAGGGGLGTTANVLLFAIFAVLLGIGCLIFRGQQMKGRAPLLIFALMSAATGATAQEENIDLRPKAVEEEQRDPRHAEEVQKNIDKLKEMMEQLKTLTNEKIDFNSPFDLSKLEERGLKNPKINVAGIMQAALNLLEAFEIIDPREKFMQADYNPPGLPILPSRGMTDNLKPEVYGEFRGLQENINKARTHLENNYVVLKQTELKTKRLEELADTAGGFSAIAGLYWAKSKADANDPMNKSKTKFYQNYDNGQESGLKFLNDTLKEMAQFELTHYGDRNWYLYFGLPYYNFMVARYVRK
jgi:hypothetical protein